MIFQHASDRYFLDSASTIAYFYEKDALDKSGKLQVDKQAALNKVGHTLHEHNDVFRRCSHHENIKVRLQASRCHAKLLLKLQRTARALAIQNPRIVQSMYIFKQRRIGGAVLEHVDSTFLIANPPAVGLWIAIDDASVENGCLWFAPGSHKSARSDYRFERCLTRDDDRAPLVHFVGKSSAVKNSILANLHVLKYASTCKK